jgi:drug/metabolite transporter superfamily protein YnfA
LSISLMARVTYICEGVILGSVSSFDKVFIRVLYYFRLQLYPLTQVLLFYLTVGRRPNCRLHLYGCLSVQTEWDFTVCTEAQWISDTCIFVLCIFGVVAVFIPGKVYDICYASYGAILLSVSLVCNTQLMLGGKHKHSTPADAYIFASLNLYLDVIHIFTCILNIVCSCHLSEECLFS